MQLFSDEELFAMAKKVAAIDKQGGAWQRMVVCCVFMHGHRGTPELERALRRLYHVCGVPHYSTYDRPWDRVIYAARSAVEKLNIMYGEGSGVFRAGARGAVNQPTDTYNIVYCRDRY